LQRWDLLGLDDDVKKVDTLSGGAKEKASPKKGAV
jgi:hypothetical protein